MGDDFVLADIRVRDVGKLDAEVLYETDAPLTDIQIAHNASMTCLKKAGENACLLYFESAHAKPDIWLTSKTLRLASLFAFDGKCVYAYTQSSLLMVEPGTLKELYVGRGPVLFPSISANRRSVAWVEGDAHRRGYVLDIDRSAEVHRVSLLECWGATWVGTGEIVAFEIRPTGEDEELCILSLHSHDGSLIREILTTDMGITKLAGDSHDRVLVVAGSRRNWGSGTWLIELNGGKQIRNIANGLPIGALIMSRGQCFFGENVRAQTPHRLVRATKNRTCRATVSDPIADFAVDSACEWLVYRTYGPKGSLMRIALPAIDSDSNETT